MLQTEPSLERAGSWSDCSRLAEQSDLVLAPTCHVDSRLCVDEHLDVDGSAADPAVLDILLVFDRVVDYDFNRLAAVWALDRLDGQHQRLGPVPNSTLAQLERSAAESASELYRSLERANHY